MSNLSEMWRRATGRYNQIKKVVLRNPSASVLPKTRVTTAVLSESENFFRQIFEKNVAVKLVADPLTTQIIEANQAACDFYGYTHEQIMSMRMSDISTLPEADFLADMHGVTQKGITFQGQHRLASGAIRDVEVFLGLIEVNNKHYLDAIIQDITERKQIEKALRESEALYRLVTRNMPSTSVIMFDTEMRYTLAEGLFIERFGLNTKSMLGKTPQEILTEPASKFLLPIYQRALQGESFTFERITDDYAYEGYIAPVLDDNGRIIGGVTLNHDITERMQAEKALREHQALYRTFARHMPNTGVLMFDNNMHYTLAEGEILKRFGTDSEALIGKTPQEVLSEETVDFFLSIYQRALQGESFTFERITDNYAYEAYVTPVRDDSGRIIGGMTLNHDITERTRAEKALRESEELHRLVTQHMPNTSVVMFDKDMRITLAEGPYLKQFGTIWDNAVGKWPQDMYSEEALKIVLPVYKRALEGKPFDFVRVTKDFAYQAYVTPLLSNTGEIIGGMILSHDISEAKRNEAALRESEALYRLFTQHMPNTSVLLFDKDMRFTLAEGDFLERVGLLPEKMIGKTPEEVLSKENLHFMQPVYQRALNGESFTYERTTPDYAYQAYANPLKNAAGEIIGGMFLSHDITAYKRSEAALRESEARFHSLVDLAPVGIIQTDALGKRIFCNTRWCEMTGITLEEALNDENFETIYPDDREKAAFAWDNMMEEHLPFENLTFRYQRPDKSTLWVSGNGRPLYDAQGQISGYLGTVSNITENLSAQEKFRQERDLLRTLIDNMPDYIFLKNAEGRFILTNEAHAGAAGIPAQDLIGTTAFDVFSPELALRFHTDDLALMQSGKSLINAERETVDAFGNIKTVLTTKIPWRDTNGQILGLIGISRDITERKQLEDALISSESRFRTLIDFAPVGIVETDAHGNTILTNTHWSSLSGLSEEDVRKNGAATTLHPDDKSRVLASHETMVNTFNPIDNMEFRFLHPDGKIVWVSDSSRPLLDPDDVVTGFIITITNITERKRLEDALRQNEEQLRIITDNIQDLVSESDGEGQLIFVSPSYQTILGYDPKSLIGTSALEMIHPDDLERIVQAFQTSSETSTQQFAEECRLRHADGHYISVEIVGKLFFEGQSQYTRGIFSSRDISERNRLQDVLLEREILQTELDKELELSSLKTRMMNRIAHEFRTPLTVIQAASETLTHYLDRLTPEQRTSRMVTIKNQIRRITDMLDEIGLVVNGSFTPQSVHRVRTDISALSRDIVDKLEKRLDVSGRFELDLPATCLASVDPQVLTNALLHILRNAARFSPADSVIKVGLLPDEKGIKITVTDHGIGILPQENQRIFEPFFRGSNIGEISGIGVGLTIARAAVEAHGGMITVESIPLQGTTVTIWLPA